MNKLTKVFATGLLTVGFAGAAQAATVVATGTACDLSGTTAYSYSSFTSCTLSESVTGNGGNVRLDDITRLASFFEDDISINAGGSYASGSSTGNTEITTGGDSGSSTSEDGMVELTYDGNSVTFSNLPSNTLFVSLKASNGSEVFGLGTLTDPYDMLQLTADADNAISNVAVFTGSIAAVPLPAGGLLLVGGLASLGLMRRKRKAA